MKTNDIFILTATAFFSYLFYQQSAGLNYLLFSLLIVLLLFLNDKTLIKRSAWLAVATGYLLSAFCVFWWGTTLPWLANLSSLFMLAGLSFNTESSLLIAAFNSLTSTVTAIPRFFSGSLKLTQPGANSTSNFTRLLLFIVPAIVTFIFIMIYRTANPIFAKLIDQINFNFISIDWCIFTVFGFFLLFGLFKQYVIRNVNDADIQSPDNLQTITLDQHLLTDLGKTLSVPNELLTGIILFCMLNVVLLCVNGIDVFYMWIANRLPAGITIAEYLHDGTDTLIISIIMAIAVILFVFRGFLNFFERNKWLKALAYLWITQNAILVITTANRNWWIIESSGLTRRRIGVYVYLLLCLVGLTTAFIKVMERKSNWFLFRKNAWVFYAVFIISCFINWDELIVNYNCKNFKELELGYIDRGYQAQLSHTSLATLFEYYAAERKEPVHHIQVFTPQVVSSMYASYERLKAHQAQAGWQSYCISRQQNLDAINNMMANNQLPYH